MNKLCGMLSGVMTFCLVSYYMSHGNLGGPGGLKPPANDPLIEKRLATIADDINRRLPIQIDPLTRMERVEAGPGKTCTYNFSLTRPLTAAEKVLVEENVTHAARTAKETKPILEVGVTLRYAYYYRGKKVISFSVSR